MQEIRVGIRELKANLSAYLRRVKAGESLIITERGRPVGRIVPVREAEALEARIQALIERGVLLGDGRPLPERGPVAVNRGPKNLSEIIVEDRDGGFVRGHERPR